MIAGLEHLVLKLILLPLPTVLLLSLPPKISRSHSGGRVLCVLFNLISLWTELTQGTVWHSNTRCIFLLSVGTVYDCSWLVFFCMGVCLWVLVRGYKCSLIMTLNQKLLMYLHFLLLIRMHSDSASGAAGEVWVSSHQVQDPVGCGELPQVPGRSSQKCRLLDACESRSQWKASKSENQGTRSWVIFSYSRQNDCPAQPLSPRNISLKIKFEPLSPLSTFSRNWCSYHSEQCKYVIVSLLIWIVFWHII